MNYLLLFINILLLVTGQVIWKIGIMKNNLYLTPKSMLNVLFNPYVLGGGIIYVAATMIWLYLLSKEELSRIYPLQSLCYVIGALIGIFFFKEYLTMEKALGLILIAAGAFFLALSEC
jgi:uncharacterized membrane protein